MASWTSARSLEDLGISRSAIATGAALFVVGFLARGFLSKRLSRTVCQSPRSQLVEKLSKDELARLPYPLDSLPGARDVPSPAGSIRVYEFGPEDGRKVLLIHGISTPCLALGGVAHGLEEKGCRVMMFDLYGRILCYPPKSKILLADHEIDSEEAIPITLPTSRMTCSSSLLRSFWSWRHLHFHGPVQALGASALSAIA